ncbi:MAG: cytochrome c oxidase subunit 3 [Cytophagaceae bacterium]|nr:cytochrome c oxidase subunit 3 [Cytophagaceae bacterium]MBK9934980.1 cytochrome c oxidase subunit 3 [Cytophagaceae bacterium]MBL0301418.1 cytochrome c oxidase subunit 3 [Cytophagaceae bacterium]MBL0324237.1 cytochrome c oxidase subunit 3 [Cytophagaceae bacterium]
MEKVKYDIFNPPGGLLIWIVIVLELLTFGIALLVMQNFELAEPQIFAESRQHLSSRLGTLNTVILLTSGLFVVLSLNNYKILKHSTARIQLNFSVILGLVFLIVKFTEYQLKLSSGITLSTNTFFTFYFLITGFHAVHVALGILIFVIFIQKIKSQKLKPEDFEAGAAFWHMCDLIWLIIFPFIYLK